MKLLQLKMKVFYLILFMLSVSNSQGQTLYGGIEIGGKGIKMSIIDVQNIKKGVYEVKEFWTENTSIVSGLCIDGNLAEKEVDAACQVVLKNYNKMLEYYKVSNDHIFIVASSGVGKAKNIDFLISKLKALTNKEVSVISASAEAKLLLKGCIPPKNYKNSMILDIGGGNTKGGYVEVINESNVFFAMSLDVGTVTLTDELIKINKRSPIYNFNEICFDYLPTLRNDFASMYSIKPESLKKDNIYLSGGAVWAVYTIFNGKAAVDNFNELKYDDILSAKSDIENNFARIKASSEENEEVKKVLQTYSQKNLIAASNLLLTALEEIPNIRNKKIFFAKQGQIAWLVSYVVDASKGLKSMY